MTLAGWEAAGPGPSSGWRGGDSGARLAWAAQPENQTQWPTACQADCCRALPAGLTPAAGLASFVRPAEPQSGALIRLHFTRTPAVWMCLCAHARAGAGVVIQNDFTAAIPSL